ncbi:hypothetical protein DXF96_10285 [Heyndrickxia coagulans]|nr:hypothetical protein CYJ15_04730 [Heyndrickxia coagulans]QDI61832.1 hypothetical protein DXF96_10285 [Heyndrickxia coagulans]
MAAGNLSFMGIMKDKTKRDCLPFVLHQCDERQIKVQEPRTCPHPCDFHDWGKLDTNGAGAFIVQPFH